ncbi:unnamed protein product [Caenorhabditis bovis]|uniref:G-protein coupled receptors family 1 profile domain-containing protein n=1 Tax=Caenorhabditis bovis TaxID=2654633 RepID=A0A8S1EKX2_9PELO|nr:unnamed protein product [Caenorhabditis bovis]
MNNVAASILNNDWDITLNYTDFHLEDLKKNHTFENDFETIVGLCVVISAIMGVLANIVVIILSFGHVKGDFSLFVANLAVVDIVCGFIFMFMGYINVNDTHNIPITFLYYMTLAFYGSFGTMICALVPISLSRVLALSNTKLYKTFFDGHKSLLFCILLDSLPVAILYIICVADHDVAKSMFYLFAAITIFAYFISFATNYMVFRVVARHIEVVQNLRDQVRLLETRQVAIATLAQALIPLLCQVPAFLTLSSILLLSEPITNGHVIYITQLWLALSPLLDAIITILVIKQYRMECFMCASTVGKICSLARTNMFFSEEKEVFETQL